jgi:hypothetical protein
MQNNNYRIKGEFHNSAGGNIFYGYRDHIPSLGLSTTNAKVAQHFRRP